MPIHERDPWRLQYFAGVACPPDVHIPTDDLDAHEWFPQLRWVYDKLAVARSQGLIAGSGAEQPPAYPVFAKPRVNLRGMGLGSRAIPSREAFLRHVTADDMWMPLLAGAHVSTDCAVVNGRVAWLRHAQGHPWTDGMFTHWVIECGQRPELTHYVSTWVAANLSEYTGMLNVETIGGTIIEAHLRFSDQWCDLYGAGWLESLVALYASGKWSFKTPCQTGYSIPLFARHGLVPPHPPDQVQATIRAMPGISSLQITYHAQKAGSAHPMPPGGFRLAVINATDLAAGLATRRQLAQAFSGCEMLIPE